jgi:hypothetical protein
MAAPVSAIPEITKSELVFDELSPPLPPQATRKISEIEGKI